MYSTLLLLHSVIRFVVLFDAILVVVFLARASGAKRFTGQERAVQLSFIISLDIMFLLGVLLYFTSPLVAAARANVGAAMKVQGLRQFLVEHPLLMIIAIAVAHVGNAISKKAPEAERAKVALRFFAASIVLMLIGMPWQRFWNF